MDQKFGCGVQDWPSSSRAEATAILTALLVTPRGSKVIIVTDSLNCITTHKKLARVDPKLTYKRWLKVKNWSIWSNVMEIIKKKELRLELKKIKAHSGNKFNEQADQLAKEANKMEAIEWCFERSKQVITATTWRNIIVEEAPREFLKEINKIKNNCEWARQRRNQETLRKQLGEANKYTWKQFWSHLQIKGLDTSFKESDRRNFRVKMLHDELPTLERMTNRRPDLYNGNNNKCRMCGSELETREHLFSCKNLESLTKQAWKNAMDKMQKRVGKLTKEEQEKKTKEETKKEETEIRDFQKEKLVDSLTKTVFDNKESRMKFALGMMRKDWISSISGIFAGELSITKLNMVLSKTSASFLEEFKKIMWRERCKETVETDKILGLDSWIKKKKIKEKAQGREKK
jgi:ribonuclease HI